MNNPGPGQYQQNGGAINKNIAYTFGMKTGSSMRPGSANVPGPGQYNINTTRVSSAGGFGTEKRETGGVTKYSALVPGPGQYFSHQSLGGPASGFGSSKRAELGSSTARVPGPGQYYNESRERLGSNAPKVSMKFRPKSAHPGGLSALDNPGPGYYNPDFASIRHTSPTSKIGTSKRDNSNIRSGDLPGPGAFNVSFNW
jgi:hypothetical protein